MFRRNLFLAFNGLDLGGGSLTGVNDFCELAGSALHHAYVFAAACVDGAVNHLLVGLLEVFDERLEMGCAVERSDGSE